MPVKDLKGSHRHTAASRAFERELHQRLAPLIRRRRDRPDDDGLLPAEPPNGPQPMSGGAAASLE